MRLRILYDNEAIPGYLSDWGFSCLLERDDKRILFDTGRDGTILRSNMNEMGIRKEEIETIVLSHNHQDHVGGLFDVLHQDVRVHLPASFPEDLKKKISRECSFTEVKGFAEIDRGVYTTGELGTSIVEQSLLIESNMGLVLLTGCAHPGLERIIDFAEEHGEVRLVVGGFHAFNRLDKLSEMKLISPCHCTSRKTNIHRQYPETSVECAAGETIEVES